MKRGKYDVLKNKPFGPLCLRLFFLFFDSARSCTRWMERRVNSHVYHSFKPHACVPPKHYSATLPCPQLPGARTSCHRAAYSLEISYVQLSPRVLEKCNRVITPVSFLYPSVHCPPPCVLPPLVAEWKWERNPWSVILEEKGRTMYVSCSEAVIFIAARTAVMFPWRSPQQIATYHIYFREETFEAEELSREREKEREIYDSGIRRHNPLVSYLRNRGAFGRCFNVSAEANRNLFLKTLPITIYFYPPRWLCG